MHPIIFQLKGFTLNTLWIFIAVAMVIATYSLIKLSTKHGLKIQFLSSNSTKLILWSLVGARIVTIFINYQTFFYEISLNAFLRFFEIWDKGLSLWGGAIGFLVYFYIICKENEQDFWKWMDVIVPSTIIGLAIGHIGNFFEGANYGSETSLPWGTNFESPSIKYTVPIHPTQIYAFIYSSLLSFGLIHLNKVEKIQNLKAKGIVGLIGFGTYNLFRFMEEFLRGDDTILFFDLRMRQIIALVLAIATIIFIHKRYKKALRLPFR